MKQCSTCKEKKSIDDFHKNKSKKDGLSHTCKVCTLARVNAWNQENKETIKLRDKDRRFARHGITEQIFLDKLISQGGVCAICKKETDQWNIDHNHSHCPGEYGCAECFRGVLCRGCNMSLGGFQDSAEILQNAIAYVTI